MQKVAAAWRSLFDIRPGEYRRTIFMSLYLLFVLFSYYVLKSASESMFLNKFDIDKLPNLYILMAIFGGALAYVYSKLAARTSLKSAVTSGPDVSWLMAASSSWRRAISRCMPSCSAPWSASTARSLARRPSPGPSRSTSMRP